MTAVTMSESDLLTGVLDLLRLYGWRCIHVRPGRVAHGWRTAVSGDGIGWPDLFAVRGSRLIAAELKTDRGRVTTEQAAWLEALGGCGGVHVRMAPGRLSRRHRRGALAMTARLDWVAEGPEGLGHAVQPGRSTALCGARARDIRWSWPVLTRCPDLPGARPVAPRRAPCTQPAAALGPP